MSANRVLDGRGARRCLSVAVIAAVAAAGVSVISARASEPVPPLYDGKATTYEILPGSILRKGESFLAGIVTVVGRDVTLKGKGVCTEVACPVLYEGETAFARRSRLRLPARPINGKGDTHTGHDGERVTLRRGDQGEAVRHLQEALNKVGAALEIDSNYGRGTRDAVTKFQEAKTLKADGVAGPETLKALGL